MGSEEVDVTTPSVTTTEETDVTIPSVTTTDETDVTTPSITTTDETDSVGQTRTTKHTETTTTVTTSPASTNQYEHAAWRVNPGGRATILSLQPAGITALYLAIYRVTNDDDSGDVQIQTDALTIDLAPGTSIDVSTQTITVLDRGSGSHGSYQNLCCAVQPLKTVATQPPAGADATLTGTAGGPPGTPTNGGGGSNGGGATGGGTGGGGGGNGGGGGSGGLDPLPGGQGLDPLPGGQGLDPVP